MPNILLGSGRKLRQDYQYQRQIKNHLESIEQPEKGKKGMVTYAKSDADSFPHQCRYFIPCNEIINNPSHNVGHFKRVHPWTEREKEYLLELFEESPNSKNLYTLSVLYGRSESELKNLFKSAVKRIPKWSKRTEEINELHELFNSQMLEIRTNHRVRLEKQKRDSYMDDYWEKDSQPKIQIGLFDISETTNSIPTGISEIQSQNYLTDTPTPPDTVGSKDFYKNTVDALFEKHKYWVAEEQRLKNRIQELDTQIAELKNKLNEKIDEKELSTEEVAEYNEQINQIYQGF